MKWNKVGSKANIIIRKAEFRLAEDARKGVVILSPGSKEGILESSGFPVTTTNNNINDNNGRFL